MKSTYRSDEYLLEVERKEDIQALMQTFRSMHQKAEHTVSFHEKDHVLFDVLRFVTDSKLTLSKLERVEPTLESLFMEVVEE